MGGGVQHTTVNNDPNPNPKPNNRARQLYKHISMFFSVSGENGKLSTGVNATFWCIMLRLVFNKLKLPYKTIA